MASVTQIVPQFSFPYTETHIYDYTELQEDEYSQVASDPAIGYIFAFGSDKGIDNRWVLKRTQDAYVKTFGTPNFKKYGQPALMPYHLLNTGSTKVWCMRCMPENATRSHAIVSLYYKADTADEVETASERRFRIKYTTKFIDPATAGEGNQIITKEDLEEVRGTLDGVASAGVYKDGEGYTQVPGIITIASNGRGKGGDNFSVRIANNVYYEKEYGIKIFTFEVLSTDKGLIKDAEYTGSLVTSLKYDSATFINDILLDANEGDVPVDINVDEEQVEAVYNAYIEFCKHQEADLAAELEQKMTENSITQAMLDGTEDVPPEKLEIVGELRELENTIVLCSEDYLPSLDSFDPIFGLNLGETTDMHPFIQFPTKLTDEIDTDADDYNATDYTQSDVVSFNNVRGVRMYGGTDGYFDNPRTVEVENKRGEKEQVQWTFQQELDECYKNAWNGNYDKRVLTAKRIGCDAMFDANYSFDVKCVMADLCLARNDALLYLDTGIRTSFGNAELKSLIEQYSVFANRLISKNVHSYTIKDPITKKNIKVTITYFLAAQFWQHYLNYGLYIPFVKDRCQLSGHVKNSLVPTVEDYETELKETLNNNRFNYFETIEDNVYQRATQNTSQSANSDLLEESNVHLLYQAKRIIEKDINARLYNFNEAEERTRFRDFEMEKFRDWNSKYVETIDITFKANKWELERSILHCYVDITFRGIYKRAIVEIDINRRTYADADTE